MRPGPENGGLVFMLNRLRHRA